MKPGYISDAIRAMIIRNICGDSDTSQNQSGAVSAGWVALSCGDPRIQLYEPQVSGYNRVKCNITSVMSASGNHTLNPQTPDEVSFYGTYNLNYLYFGEVLTVDGWPSGNNESGINPKLYTHFAIMSSSSGGTMRYSGELNTPLQLETTENITIVGTIPLIRPQKLIVAIN